MNKLNKKGFTLIELLAVIVILAVVLGIAIPAVSQYITKSRKNGYVDNLVQFIDAARKGATLGDEYSLPVDNNHATVIYFSKLAGALEKGGQTSSYGEEWELDGSFVAIVNDGTADSPKYTYYVTASDGKYVSGGKDSSSNKNVQQIIEESTLKASNIVRLDSKGIKVDSTTTKWSVSKNTSSGNSILTTAPSGNIVIDEIIK